MAYAIVTLAHKSVVSSYLVEGSKWADALNALEGEMDNARGYGFKVSVKGTWARPYARRGEAPRATSFSAYTKGYSQFVYIKKVDDGLSEEEVFDLLSKAQAAKHPISGVDELADHCGVARPRSAEEREEFLHCWEMGDFDY